MGHYHPTLPLLLLLLLLLLFPPPSALAAGGGSTSDSDSDSAAFVGVSIGTAASGVLSARDLAAFLVRQRIKHVRLYDADAGLLSALAGTGVRVVVGVPNSHLLALAASPASALSWLQLRVLPFLPATLVSHLALGDDLPISAPSLLPSPPRALALSAALSSSTSPAHQALAPLPFSPSSSTLPPSQPPSTAPSSSSSPLAFSRTPRRAHGRPLPYYALTESRGAIPLDNALFRPLPPAREEVDPNTLLHYTNVYDAMVDALYFAMRDLNFSDVPILVTETGWPSYGDPRTEPFATRDNADSYNSNLIKHVLARSGTPLRPEYTPGVFIYELFDEDLRPGPASEANWGLFYGNGTPVYLLHVDGAGGFLANDTTERTYCVAAEGADEKTLQAALDWACGPGRSNCSEIQPGESCYDPNDVRSHASYAFDSYYQMHGKATGDCYFQGAAMLTTSDPSEFSYRRIMQFSTSNLL
ncbi:Glucan endo-1,3-beta-glucosidase 1 [Ananas comosus]|uniref:Glucan endo-1,3-beta-glucosidase 1 n=1 Tax=Ananas comosus TaxID=4615 RepID=A0A199UR52_ANACO|nr:Glucan endo-1,3-beta-glucosidase 1 [Ananas comosus]